jgi:hypothetical protein
MKPKKAIIVSLTAILFIFITGYIISQSNVPKGWFIAGSKPGSYETGIDTNAGENILYFKSIKENIDGFGTLMQNFSADNYLNKRVRLSGYIKSKDVAETAGFWMRIDGKENPQKPLAFDNMGNRPITGTTEWKKYDVVLDVDSNATMINFGILLSSTGQVWVRNLKFQIVDKSVPTTDLNISSSKPTEPVNLDFEK